MIDDQLNKSLKDYYQKRKAKDLNQLPDFETLTKDLSQTKPKGLVYYLKIAATILILIALGYWIQTSNDVDSNPLSSPVYTNNLIASPEYVWEWESPTQSLLEYSNKIILK